MYRKAVASAALSLLVAACGGGGSGDPTGGTAPPAPPPSGGAQKTVYVLGAITGFGSVIVNGVRYETTGTEVQVDDRPGSLSELHVGQVIRLEARIDDRGQARAVRIEERHLLRGAVQSVDSAAGTLTVAGQRVRVDNDTSFDDSIAGGTLGGIAPGERIEVHGFSGSDGHALATRIERASPGEAEVEVTGIVANLDTTRMRFSIGSLVVDHSAATLEDFGSAGLSNGQLVEVKGREFHSDGTLRASRVEREDRSAGGSAGGDAEVEGLVTRFVSATDFSVAGQSVTTTAGTLFEGGTAADLALDRKVEVEGRLDTAGVLIASKVAFKRPVTAMLAAPVEAVDPAAGTLRALGITIAVDATTRREDKIGDDRSFSLADLRVGDWIEVKGYPNPTVPGRMIATRLERDEPEDEVELRGPADNLQAPGFRMLGVAIETTPATQFEDGDQRIDAATFFDRAAGLTVEVDGTWNGSTLIADEAEIERHAGTISPPVQPPSPPPSPPPAPPPPPPPSLDGAALYAARCASCHGAINAIRSMPVSNRTAADFRRAISANRGGMGFLASMSDVELQAIATAIAAANP